MAKYTKLALRGGGVRGIIYIGLIDMLTQLGVLKDIDAVSGSSVGAIGALLVATGWSVDKIKEKMLSLDFEKIINSDSVFSKVPIIGAIAEPAAEAKNFEKHHGLHRAQGFEDFFKAVIKEVTGDENTTFAKWHELIKSRPELKDIFVEACNMNTEFNEVFSWKSQHKDVPIWQAIRASMAFPLYFTPQEINGVEYADGGMQKNCPNDVFETTPGVPNPEVLSVWLDTKENINYFVNKVPPTGTKATSTISYLSKVINAATSSQSYDLLTSQYRERMIYCDTVDVDTLDFTATKDPTKIDAMIASGEYAGLSYFLRKHPEMVAKKIDEQTVRRIELSRFARTISEFVDMTPAELEKEVETPDAAMSSSKVASLSHKWLTCPALQHQKDKQKPQASTAMAASGDDQKADNVKNAMM